MAGAASTRAAAGDRRRGLGQDDDAGRSRGPAGARRRGSRSHPAADLFAARGAEMERRVGRVLHQALGFSRRSARPAAVGRHVPRHRCAAAARVRAAHRARRERSPSTTAATPRTCWAGAPGARAGRRRASAFREGHLPGDLFARGQQPEPPGDGAARRTSRGARSGRRAESGCSAPTSRRSRSSTSLDYDDLLLYWARRCRASRRSPPNRRRASITCWSTSTRTPTACRPTILLALKPDGRGLTVVGDDAQSIYSFRAADGAQHPRLSAAASPAGAGGHARAQLPFDAADPRRRRTRSSRWPRERYRQGPVDRARRRRSGRGWSWCADEAEQARWVADAGAGATARPGCR